MKKESTKQESIGEKLEFEENKFMLFIDKFCQFSKFYGEYLATMHSKPHQHQFEKRKQRSHD